jgi:hypothetical protein
VDGPQSAVRSQKKRRSGLSTRALAADRGPQTLINAYRSIAL